MGKRMLFINGVDRSDIWVGMDNLKPSGPGSVGSATLSLEKQAGGVTILNKQLVQLWEAFDSAGAGVAPRGRWLQGVVDGRITTSKANIKQWQLKVTDLNKLLKDLRIDIDDSAAVTIAGGSFASQIAATVQAFQRQGAGSVNISIDASTNVVDLVPSGMPAYIIKGKTLGQALLEICTNARAINPALRPQFYIGVGATFGIAEVFGAPSLWLWDGAVTGTPVYVFSDTPSGAQKYRYGSIKRGLDSTQLSTRAQSTYGPNHLPATYADATAGGTYPNRFINHGLPPGANSGHWQGIDPAHDNVSTTLSAAQNMLRQKVDLRRYPREVYEHGADVPILPGETVTEIDSLEDGLGGGVDYRVAQVGIDVSTDTDPFYSYVLANRRLELLETGEDILAAPAEIDNTAPLAPTGLTLVSTIWDNSLLAYRQNWMWTNSASRDVDRHVFWDTSTGYRAVLHLEGSLQRIVFPGQPYNVYITALDTATPEHESAPSNVVSGSVPARPAVTPPTGFGQTNAYNYGTLLTDITFSWTPPADASVSGYSLEFQEDGVQRVILLGLLSAFIVGVAPGALIHQARIAAISRDGYMSTYAPSSGGLADFTVADYPLTIGSLRNPSFEIPGKVSVNDARWWSLIANGNASAVRSQGQHIHGSWAMLLTHGTGGLSQTAIISSTPFPLSGTNTDTQSVKVRAWGVAGGETLQIQLVFLDESGTPLSAPSQNFTMPVTPGWDIYELLATPGAGSNPVRGIINIGEVDSTTTAKQIYVDAVEIGPAVTTRAAGLMLAADKKKLDYEGTVALLTNKSGGSVAKGDVVIVDTTTDSAFTTSTTPLQYNRNVGVALESIASNAAGWVLLEGWVSQVNLKAAATRGDYLVTSNVAKLGTSGAWQIGAFGQALGTSSSPPAWIWGYPQQNPVLHAVTHAPGGSDVIADLDSGSSFPGGPATHRRYLRSDLDKAAIYDGSRWLSAEEFPLAQWNYYPGAELGELTVSQEYMNTALRKDYAVRITRLSLYGYVNGTNNGSNYWKFHLRTFTGQVDLQSTPESTASWSGATWTYPANVTSFNTQPSTSDMGLQWYIEKILSPGPLRFYFSVWGRLVYT